MQTTKTEKKAMELRYVRIPYQKQVALFLAQTQMSDLEYKIEKMHIHANYNLDDVVADCVSTLKRCITGITTHVNEPTLMRNQHICAQYQKLTEYLWLEWHFNTGTCTNICEAVNSSLQHLFDLSDLPDKVQIQGAVYSGVDNAAEYALTRCIYM